MKIVDNFAIARELPFPQVAQYYGLQFHGKDMCSCPFHTDKHPSMKIYADHGYCFSCGTYVDSIGLVQRLYECSAVEALDRIKADFGLSQDTPRTMTVQKQNYLAYKKQEQDKDDVIRETIKFYKLLQFLKQQYSPKHTGGVPNDLFLYAINNEAYTGYILDILFAPRTKEEENQIINRIAKSKWFENIKKINNI